MLTVLNSRTFTDSPDLQALQCLLPTMAQVFCKVSNKAHVGPVRLPLVHYVAAS